MVGGFALLAQKHGAPRLIATGRITSASLVYAAGTLLAKASKFILIPIFVSALTAADVGTVYFLEAVITVGGRLYSLALGSAVRRLAVEFPSAGASRVYVKTVWFGGLAAALVLYLFSALAITALGTAWSLQVPAEAVSFALAIGAIRSCIHVPQNFLILGQQAARHEFINIIDLVGTAALVIFAITRLDLGLPGYLYGQFAGALLVAGVSYALVGRERGFSMERVGESFQYALPGLPHFMFGWGLTFADRLVVERFVPMDQLAVYVVGYQVASLVPVVTLALNNAYSAKFFRQSNDAERARRFAADFPVLLAIIAAAAAGLAVATPWVFTLLAGPGYALSPQVARIVALGLVFHGAFQLLLLCLYFDRRTGLVSLVSGTSLALNIALNIILIPRMGIVGAAWATVGSFAAAAAFSAVLVGGRYLRGVRYLRLAPSAFAIAVVLATIWAGLP